MSATAARDVARQAVTEDHEPLAVALAEAFQDDPVAAWACPDDDLRPAMLRRFYLAYLAAVQRHDWVWAAPELAGAALWAPPDDWRLGLADALGLARAMMHPRLIARLPRVGRGVLRVDHEHPREPSHFHLAVLGVAPRAQGGGLGSELLAPTLSICDSDGVAAYLESSKEDNIPFYARHGFRVTGEIKLPKGPTIYKMWRRPA